MNMKKSPCMGCTDRVIGCHSNCKNYLQWHEEQLAVKEKTDQARYDHNAGTTSRYWSGIRKKYGER